MPTLRINSPKRMLRTFCSLPSLIAMIGKAIDLARNIWVQIESGKKPTEEI